MYHRCYVLFAHGSRATPSNPQPILGERESGREARWYDEAAVQSFLTTLAFDGLAAMARMQVRAALPRAAWLSDAAR